MRTIFHTLFRVFIVILLLSGGAVTGKDRVTQLLEGRARLKASSLKNFNSARQARQTSIVPFYLEEFTSGIPSGWRNIDSAASGRRWLHSNNACGMCDALYIGTGVDSLSVVGTSSANGIVMYDSDSSQSSIGGDYGVLITPAINCSGRTAVQLSFSELFVYCNDQLPSAYPNTGRVYVSNNNVNWTLVHVADAGLASCGDATDNPNLVTVDITGIAANQPTVYVRFTYTGDYSYWWFLDDVALSQPFPYEAELVSISPIFNGCTLGNSEAVSITLRNNGTQTLANFPVSYSVNGGSAVTETITNPVVSNGTLTYTFNQRANLSASGTYTIIASVNVNNDAYTLNNQDTLTTVSIAASAPAPYVNGLESNTDILSCKTLDWDGDGVYPVRSTQNPHSGNYSIRFPGTASGTTYDKWVFLPCMDLVAGQDYILQFWDSYQSTSNSGDLRTYLCSGIDPADTLQLLQGCNLTPTTGYSQHSCSFVSQQTGTHHIAFRRSGYNVQSYMDMDDINLDLTVGIDAPGQPAQFQISPNPSDGHFTLHHGAAGRFILTDAMGKELWRNVASTGESVSIDVSWLPAGIYFLRAETKDGMFVRRLSISQGLY